MGHIARELEAAGVSTVIVAIRAFRDRLMAMGVPRLLTTPYPMGRPVGAPGDVAGQRRVLQAALDLLENADCGGAVVEFPGRYRPGR